MQLALAGEGRGAIIDVIRAGMREVLVRDLHHVEFLLHWAREIEALHQLEGLFELGSHFQSLASTAGRSAAAAGRHAAPGEREHMTYSKLL